MVSLLQSIILSIIQGITEWLPISSSGHLALLHNFFGFQNLPFDVFLHFASILAVIVVFWKDIIRLLNFKEENIKYILKLLVALIPAGIIGILFKEQIENFFSSFFYLGMFFMISGVIIYSTKFSIPKKEKPNFLDSIIIGFFQALAILPGVSRSGATISSGLIRGVKKEEAVKFSFLLAIPIVLGASLLEVKDLVMENIDLSILLISFIVTFVVSLFVIKVLLRIIKDRKFYIFGIYDFILGLIVFISSFFL